MLKTQVKSIEIDGDEGLVAQRCWAAWVGGGDQEGCTCAYKYRCRSCPAAMVEWVLCNIDGTGPNHGRVTQMSDGGWKSESAGLFNRAYHEFSTKIVTFETHSPPTAVRSRAQHSHSGCAHSTPRDQCWDAQEVG